jgi:endo-1,4-beta-xylanase
MHGYPCSPPLATTPGEPERRRTIPSGRTVVPTLASSEPQSERDDVRPSSNTIGPTDMPSAAGITAVSPATRRIAVRLRCCKYRLLPLVVLAGLLTGGGAAQAEPTASSELSPRSCRLTPTALRGAGRKAGIRLGVGHEAGVPADDRLLAREFDSLTLEGSLLWSVVHPAPDRWDFTGADRSIAWARRNRLRVTATHFVWDQILYQSTPAWVKQVTDPAALRAVMADHLGTISRRYGRGIARWIVVNEPLRYVGDTAALQDNHFSRVLGPDWIAETFRIARRAAPRARLWLNEVFTEVDLAKARGLVELARSLVSRGVPIHGVGLEGHLFTNFLQPTAPRPEVVRETLRELTALGLQVSFTEIDAPTFPDTPDRLAEQARRVRALVDLCLEFRRCKSVTFWNLHDGRSWLNSLFRRSDLAPTLFGASLLPKPAYFSVREALQECRAARRREADDCRGSAHRPMP